MHAVGSILTDMLLPLPLLLPLMVQGERSQRLLRLTQQLIQLNSADYTAWQVCGGQGGEGEVRMCTIAAGGRTLGEWMQRGQHTP